MPDDDYELLANFFSFHSCSLHTKPLREVVVSNVYCGTRSECPARAASAASAGDSLKTAFKFSEPRNCGRQRDDDDDDDDDGQSELQSAPPSPHEIASSAPGPRCC